MVGDFRESFTPMNVLFGFLAGITGIAGSYAVTGYTREFVVAPIDALVVRLTPGVIVTYVIENIGDRGHLLHVALSFAIVIGLLTAISFAGFLVARRFRGPIVGSLLAGALAWVLTIVLTAQPTSAVAVAVPVAVFTAAGIWQGSSPTPDQSQRRTIISGAGALAFIGMSIGIGRLTADNSGGGIAPLDEESVALMNEAEDKTLEIEGDIPGLVSTFDEFYNVDIAQFDPELSAEGWSLTITGEVGHDVTVTFDDITGMPTERRFNTLRCVGDSLNGHKLDNAVWTGTPIQPLLEEADPAGKCGCAMLRAEDGYFVQFPIEALENGFLAWGMNGQALPKSHGHPVRVLVPGHWGETNVKWLSEIELLEEEMDGYWEQRGWQGTGPVNTIAKLWSDTRLDNGNIELAGHAYAGTRGIDRVEVSIDGGDTWQDTDLSAELQGEDVWRQWRFEFDPEGTHEVVVRAIDGEGNLQTEEPADPAPSGATGWVSKTVKPL
jgi:DMSO/TMAO reductase YedYZ molybdopterin-dependent catalytic subunit